METVVLIFIGIIAVVAISVFVFINVTYFSPKLSGKFMARHLKSTKYMLDESKDDLTSMATMAGNIGIKVRKNIMDENEDVLRDLSKREAEIVKDKIEITARAIKDGFSEKQVYCKHCGSEIDKDSKFCKNCGKEL